MVVSARDLLWGVVVCPHPSTGAAAMEVADGAGMVTVEALPPSLAPPLHEGCYRGFHSLGVTGNLFSSMASKSIHIQGVREGTMGN